jgi:hypothetical protein
MQTDRQTDHRQTDRKTDRQTDRPTLAKNILLLLRRGHIKSRQHILKVIQQYSVINIGNTHLEKDQIEGREYTINMHTQQ